MTAFGLLYREGKFDEVFELAEKALEVAKEVYGNEHEHVATSIHNLAEMYRVREDLPKAKELYLQAISLYEKISGSHHARLVRNSARLDEKKRRRAVPNQIPVCVRKNGSLDR